MLCSMHKMRREMSLMLQKKFTFGISQLLKISQTSAQSCPHKGRFWDCTSEVTTIWSCINLIIIIVIVIIIIIIIIIILVSSTNLREC